jgi:hypothetical protein
VHAKHLTSPHPDLRRSKRFVENLILAIEEQRFTLGLFGASRGAGFLRWPTARMTSEDSCK